MKPGTFTQLHVQLVFAVKYRESLLRQVQRKEVFSYISGIVTNLKHKSLIVNGYSDHVHIFLGMNPSISVSDTVSAIKKSSTFFINNQRWFPGTFRWQDGYGGFTYSKSQVKDVYNYILNQKNHHKSIKFRQEYIDTLSQEGIEFNELFLPEFFDDIDINN
ncbi:MAG: IS200/IS605 family transposase [Bacteroidia bacterium]|nr:IS200/IS605 family transposase [Bacteroidia bacterium]